MARQILLRGSELVGGDFSLPRDSWWTAAGKINEMSADLYSFRSDITSAGDDEYDAPTFEASIVLADAAALSAGKSLLFIPASKMPHDISLCPPTAGIRRVREGGDFSVHDVQAYGADPTGVVDAGPAFNACRAAIPATGGPMRVPFGTYNLATAFTFGGQTNVTVTIDPGTTLTGQALPVPALASSNTIFDNRRGFGFTGAIQVVGPANLPVAEITVPFVRASVGGGDFGGVNEVPGQANLWAVGMGNTEDSTGTLVLRRARLDGSNLPTNMLADNSTGIIKFGGHRGDPGGGGSPFATAATIGVHAHGDWTPSAQAAYMLFAIRYPLTTTVSAFEIRGTGTANEIFMRVYDFSAGGLVRVSRGAVDTGGAGFRVLRVPN